MSFEPDLLRYVGVYEEPNGSYQVDNSGTPGDFLALPYEENSLNAQFGREPLNPMTGKMRLDGDDKRVLGVKSCTLSVASKLHSHGLDLDGDVTAPTVSNWALLRVLKAIFGGVAATTNVGAQTTVQAGSTTTSIVCNDASHAARFQAGGAVAVPTTSGSALLEAGEVLSVSGDTVNLKMALSATPVTGQPVRGAVTVYPTEDPNTSLQVLVEGREANDAHVLRGLQGGVSLSLPIGQLGQISFNLNGAGWEKLSSSSATVPSHTNVNHFALAPLRLMVGTVGSTTRVVVGESEVTIQPGIAYAPVRSGNADETIARMRRSPTRPPGQGSFTAPIEDLTWYTAHDNRDDRAIFIQGGALAGGMVLISMPTVQLGQPQPAPSGEQIAGQQVPFIARHDEEIGGSTELGYAFMRMHFF